jgi:uncharacterized protein (TIGR00369 family)
MIDQRIAELETMFNQTARIARTLGLTLTFDDQRRAVITMPYHPGYDHALGGVHGGIYMTLLDSAAWFTAAAAHNESIWVATSELTVHLLKPVQESALRAVGSLIQAGSRLDIAEARVYDDADLLVAHAVGTFVVLGHLSTDNS